MISVITINFNNAQGLKKTFESIKNLNKKDFEYIVIDGGSTDESLELIKANSKIITKYVSEKDKGIYDAINKGINLATGSIIGLVHAGDEYLSDALDTIEELHQKNPESILYGAMKTSRNGVFDSIWGFNACNLTRQMIPHLSCFVPKVIYQKSGMYDLNYKIAADYECFLRFYTQNVQFVFVDKIICNFDLDGVSQRTSGTQTEEEVIAIKKKYGFYKEPSKKEKIKQFIKKFF